MFVVAVTWPRSQRSCQPGHFCSLTVKRVHLSQESWLLSCARLQVELHLFWHTNRPRMLIWRGSSTIHLVSTWTRASQGDSACAYWALSSPTATEVSTTFCWGFIKTCRQRSRTCWHLWGTRPACRQHSDEPHYSGNLGRRLPWNIPSIKTPELSYCGGRDS